MKQYQIKNKEVFGLHKILYCITSPIDYEMERLLILEGEEYDEYIIVEGSHCSCFDFDEAEWDATLFENKMELLKLLRTDNDFLRKNAFKFMLYYLDIKEEEINNMELEIYDALAEYFDNIKIDVEYKDVRQYEIKLQIETKETQFFYLYDAHLTFDANIANIKREIERCIINYYHR